MTLPSLDGLEAAAGCFLTNVAWEILMDLRLSRGWRLPEAAAAPGGVDPGPTKGDTSIEQTLVLPPSHRWSLVNLTSGKRTKQKVPRNMK